VELRGKRKPIHWLTHDGIRDTAAGWGRRLKMDSQVILMRIRHGRSVAEALDPTRLKYVRVRQVYRAPPKLPAGMSPELAAAERLISADEYLDCYGVPRRRWSTPA
jgi:hypothetical protein